MPAPARVRVSITDPCLKIGTICYSLNLYLNQTSSVAVLSITYQRLLFSDVAGGHVATDELRNF